MKKGKGVIIVTIGLVCFILSYVMFMQFKVVKEADIAGIESLRESELREMLATWKDKYEETVQKLEETNSKLQEYKQKRESNQVASELLENELLQAQMLVGLTDVTGNGIVITMKDNEETEGHSIGAEDLLDLVNELQLAGAEAISINDERIINMSDIVDVYEYIMIDGKRITAPYVIKAIGDQKYLESALTTKTVGYLDKYSKSATLQRQNNIKIGKYVASYTGLNKAEPMHIKTKEEQK